MAVYVGLESNNWYANSMLWCINRNSRDPGEVPFTTALLKKKNGPWIKEFRDFGEVPFTTTLLKKKNGPWIKEAPIRANDRHEDGKLARPTVRRPC
ncbi:hypothetical protein CEXT_465221 [Caerostris extrusa]|uniref:Uncharacterized protein n=1 Tax=Caerostris extrusa TaxID=172846 RepID=A0AAV4WUS2_CAEEX|nr:hypothetical protein CEXT_465221 [Caerostris extrusa]